MSSTSGNYRQISPREQENLYPDGGDLLNFEDEEIETHPLSKNASSKGQGRKQLLSRTFFGIMVLCLAAFGFSYTLHSSKFYSGEGAKNRENEDIYVEKVSGKDGISSLDETTDLTAPSIMMAATNETFSKVFKVSNKYIARDGPLGSSYPWLAGRQLAEPYFDTTFTVVTPSVSNLLKGILPQPEQDKEREEIDIETDNNMNMNMNEKNRKLKLHLAGRTAASRYSKKELNELREEDSHYKETHFHDKAKHQAEIMSAYNSGRNYVDSDQDEEAKSYVWTIEDSKYSGSSVTHNFIETGTYSVILEEYEGDQLVATYSEDLVIKYVRRELRSLTEDDAELFFATAKTLWDVNSEDGKIAYGDEYKDIEYFTSLHGELAGSKDCDHIHDGMAFVPFHIAISMKFEKALQLIDPQVSLPYWDYSIDFENIASDFNGTYSKSWFESEVWKSDWFGKIDMENNLNHVTEGRWAYTEMPGGGNKGMTYTSSDYVHNSYGYLRAPWNQNPSKYITRSSTSCGADYDVEIMGTSDCNVNYQIVFNSQYQTFEEFSWFIPGPAHGPVHMLTGGITGCSDDYDSLIDEGFSEEHVNKLKFTAFISRKNYYRSGYLSCPDTCSTETNSECTCSCPNLDEDIANGKMHEYLTKLVYNGGMSEFMETYTPKQLKTLIQTACEANIIDGDQLEASSPADISFWPIHPTMERIWQFKNLKGFLTDSSWPVDKVSIYGDSCTGHASNDTIKIDHLVSTTNDYITNEDFMNYINPTSDNLDYIYDDFSWSHCVSKGYDFSKGNWIIIPDDAADGTGSSSASGGASIQSNKVSKSTEGKLRFGAMG